MFCSVELSMKKVLKTRALSVHVSETELTVGLVKKILSCKYYDFN